MSHHWAEQNERGNRFFLNLTAWLVRHTPTALMRIITAVVCFYFYATAPRARAHIRAYQGRLKNTFPDVGLPGYFSVYRQFAAFGDAVGDRFAVWQGKIRYEHITLDDPDNLYADIRQTGVQGQILICSHLGNVEICRALAGHHPNFKLNVLVHSRHAQNFNRALKKAGASDIRLIQVDTLDTALMMRLADKLQQGEWLAIAADRIPVRGEKTVSVRFLGDNVALPQGAWLLAHILKARTNTLFVIKENGRYRLSLRRFTDVPPTLRREGRDRYIAQTAQRYADILAEQARQAPLQWFNFFDFWSDHA